MKLFPRTLISAAATLAAASSAIAATDTWIGNSSVDWADAANWGGTAPVGGDSLVFGGSGTSGTTLTDTLTGASFSGITFNSGAPAYTMGGNAFTLTGDITNNAAATQTINQAITFSGTNTITTIAGGGITFGGAFGGSGSVIVAGAGTTTLVAPTNAAWTLPLATTVSAQATLALQFQSAPTTFQPTNLGAITVNSGGVLNLNGNATTFDYNYINAGSITGSGTITKTGAGDVDFFTGLNLFTGNIDIQAGVLGSNNSGWSTSATMAMNVGSGAFFDIRVGSVGVSALTGSGTVGSSNTTVGLTVGNGDASSTFGGVIQNNLSGFAGGAGGGSGLSLTKVGAGTLTLTGTNTYTGATTLSGGTLQIGAGGTTGSLGTGAVTDNAALVFDRTDAVTIANTISGIGSVMQSGTGELTLTGTNTYTGATTVSAGTLNVSGSLTSAITVNSGGTLAGAGSTTGNLTLSNGATIVGAAGTTAGTNGTAFTVGNIDTSAGGILVTGAASAGGLVDIVGYTGTWTGSSADFNLSSYRVLSAVTSVAGTTGNKLQFTTGVLTDTWTGNSGTGTWDNSHAAGVWSNTGVGADNLFYSGDTVQFNDIGGQSAGTVTIGAAVTPGSTTFNNSTTNYTLQGAGGIATGGITKNGSGTLTVTNINTTTGPVTLNAGVVNITQGAALGSGVVTFAGGTLNYTGTAASDTLTASGMVLDAAASIGVTNASSTLTYAGVISGSGALTVSGPGTLTLSGANTYTGVTTVTSGTLAVTGSIAATSSVTLGGSSGTSGVLSVSGGDLSLTGLTTAAGGGASSTLTYNNTGAINSGVSITGTTTLNSALTVKLTTLQGQVTFAGITGSGVAAGSTALSFLNNGGSRFYINGGAGTYNYTGNVEFLAATGAYTFQTGNIFTTNTSVTVDSGAVIQTNWSGTFALDALNGAGQWDIYNGTTSTLSIGNGGGSGTFSGTITNSQGTNSVIKNGTGTQIFSGANTYTGTTTVSGGTLLINGSLASGSAVTVASGAVLGGAGTVSGTITVNGTLQGGAGAATGTLTTGGAVTLASGSIVQLALGVPGTSSKIAVGAGGMTFQANQEFTFLNIGGAAAPGAYTLITGLASDPGSESGWTITNAGWAGTFDYNAGTISLNLTAVPEPSTYGLLGAGALAAVACVRRRRKLAGITA